MTAITGEKELVINKKKYVVKFTWKALSVISEKYGDSPNILKPEVVADVASIGLIDRYPEMTPEKIMELSPPLMPFANDIQTALKWAYFGNDNIPELDEKKSPKKIGFLTHIKTLFT